VAGVNHIMRRVGRLWNDRAGRSDERVRGGASIYRETATLVKEGRKEQQYFSHHFVLCLGFNVLRDEYKLALSGEILMGLWLSLFL